MDYQIFDAPPKRTVGFHAIQHEAWKMNFIDRGQTDYQPLLAHTVSNTWNGRSLSHGTKLERKARYEGMESVTVPAGTFDCERFHWVNPLRRGPPHLVPRSRTLRGQGNRRPR